MRARVCGPVMLILTTVACGSAEPTANTARGFPIPISFPVGNGQSDTIQATLGSTLVVRIGNGPHGQSGANQVVHFEAVQDSGQFRALVQPAAGGAPSTFVAETTDTFGEAPIFVVLGQTAGLGHIVVTAPAFGYVDTAHVTVQPGHAVGMFVAPNDTTAYLGGTVALRTSAVDRFGNPRSDPVSFFVLGGPGTVSGSTLTINSYGPIQVVGSSDGYIDTTTVYGVPKGAIAASGDITGIFTFSLDGSNFAEISTTFGGTLKWAPNGSSLVFDQIVGGLYGANDLLQSIRLDGVVTTLVNSGSSSLAYPQYTRDGQWIYYNEASATHPMWRVHPDGTGDTTVTMVSPEALQFPSPSSDGTQVSYILGNQLGDLKVLTLSSGAAVDLGVKGNADVWSPVGNVIAYTTLSNAMAIINSDGTGNTTLAPGPYGTQFDWSPDGQWIIARNTATSRLELIQLASHLVIPLGYTGTVGSPTWH